MLTHLIQGAAGVATIACQDSFLFGCNYVRSPLPFVSFGQSAARALPRPSAPIFPFFPFSEKSPSRRRSSIAGIDLQMMTNAPFFRMKTALAKPTTIATVHNPSSPSPQPAADEKLPQEGKLRRRRRRRRR